MEQAKEMDMKLKQLEEKVKSLLLVKREDQVVSRERSQAIVEEAKEVFYGLICVVTDCEANLAAAEEKADGSLAAEDVRREVAAARAEVEAGFVELEKHLEQLDLMS